MKFGLFFAFQLPRPWAAGFERAAFDEALEQVELADRIGIQHCWGQEHDFLEEYSHSSAPEVYLGAFTQRTKRIRIGHGVVHMPPRYNNTARIAARLGTLDLLSGGRVEWGTGEGGTRIELGGYNIPYVEKRPMWEEAVRECANMMASAPYAGHAGEFVDIGQANIVPKPLQRPHPPLWIACTNRASLRHAAKAGAGALTFAFIDAKEAKFWVEEYYETFRNECEPVARSVNPNVAMLTQFMCNEDRQMALKRGYEGARFFAYGLAHYFRNGPHIPGRTNVWKEFQGDPLEAMGGNYGLGTPAEIEEHFRSFEEAGVDQLILLQQAGHYKHEHIMDSLSLFGRTILPGFIEREAVQDAEKAASLAPYIKKALSKVESRVAANAAKPVAAEA